MRGATPEAVAMEPSRATALRIGNSPDPPSQSGGVTSGRFPSEREAHHGGSPACRRQTGIATRTDGDVPDAQRSSKTANIAGIVMKSGIQG